MAYILILPLSDNIKLVIDASSADLATITCCDMLNLILVSNDQKHVLLEGFTGCSLHQIQNIMKNMLLGNATKGSFVDVIFFNQDQCNQVLIEIQQNQKTFCYGLMTFDMIKSWIDQLDLLIVLMEENEKEKKSRGTGCCG